MVLEGVAQPLLVQEDPIEKYLLANGQCNLLSRDAVYSSLNKALFLNTILGE
jgi:hypothetical protein